MQGKEGTMIQINDEETYSEIVEKFSDMIFRIAYQNLLNFADSEDIVQEVFVKLLCHRREFEDEEHLKAWLIRVTVNQCRDFRRVFLRRQEVELTDVEASFEPREEWVLDELAKLSKYDRTVIYLHDYEGYTVQEIAEILKKKPNTISSRLTRARAKLKVILQEGGWQNGYV